jgi:hypothetical protein
VSYQTVGARRCCRYFMNRFFIRSLFRRFRRLCLFIFVLRFFFVLDSSIAGKAGAASPSPSARPAAVAAFGGVGGCAVDARMGGCSESSAKNQERVGRGAVPRLGSCSATRQSLATLRGELAAAGEALHVRAGGGRACLSLGGTIGAARPETLRRAHATALLARSRARDAERWAHMGCVHTTPGPRSSHHPP